MKLKTIRIALMSVFISAAASAQNSPTAAVSSFRFSGARTNAAELCGKTTGLTQFPSFIKVTADPTTDSPAIYNVAIGSEQLFCVTLTTFTGKAEISLWSNPTARLTVEVKK